MSQFVQQIIDSAAVRKILSLAGVSDPVNLDRFDTSQAAYLQGNVLVGGTANSIATEAMLTSLSQPGVNLYYPADSDERFTLEKIASANNIELTAYQPEIQKDLKFKAAVFDGTGLKHSEELVALHHFFQPVIRKLAKSSRILVVGKTPETLRNPKAQTAQRALEGFTRCLGKEVGKKGTTVQLMYMANKSESGAKAPLEFLLSPKSAYVSAQVLRLAPSTADVPAYEWSQPLAGKVAVVTGASRGIGAQIAKVMARDGAKVIGVDLDGARADLDKVARETNGLSLCLDISAKDAGEQIEAFLKENGLKLDIIVHNAGITRDKTLANMPEHFWLQAIQVNLTSAENINDYLVEKELLTSGGRIICVSSVSGIAGNFGQTNYGTSKAGVVGLVQSQASAMQKLGITINAVAPGFIETQMTQAMPVLVREVAKRINALGQAGRPVDVAEAIAFFASPGAQMVNGNVIRVCGQSMLGA
ncbi:3-oxoacyl-[acyl-carrier-protein] reductase FabG [BD1-7 clade bacterium]|uniref:3-oxoacyl-[acyl-carrier-protein] reductase FabG n=1 Tax=BD1-7 clade bacterium TaxID=2029982 RepID=A0A5S9QQY6_9GAMM|nr:3-oxoacyl-[acyl-carrier-protein] reductase FabG [BD1-7 clade bacterium]